MASTGDFIKFDPDKIAEIAVGMDKQQKRFIQSTEDIKKEANSLKSIWRGDTAELYLMKINELDSQSAKIAKGFQTFDQELQTASGIYRSGEASAMQVVEALPTDMFEE
jgi:WXG100 family type VII secretion target